MPLTTTEKMLAAAKKNGYAVAAFNCENMEMIQAIIAAAAEMNAPVILQTTPSTVNYASARLFAANAAAAAEKADIPVALHLDHGNSHELVKDALDAGYTSIMIDGSHFPLEENIAFTKKAASLCLMAGIPIEGELGHVGGKEDDLESAGAGYTDPEEAVRFVKETGVSSLAIGVGTAHGVYAKKPVLNPQLISILKERITVPLVLHGASGLDDEVVQDCIARGISKVNIATDLRIAYTQAVREYLQKDPGCFDPKKYGNAGREAVIKLTIKRIKICGCQGRAGEIN
ncbi:MAG: class II fructose-bisphosphate aldolase [Treponema sp.]|nr:class II fructose-bisphosphate aldolase [Treponema sp.]